MKFAPRIAIFIVLAILVDRVVWHLAGAQFDPDPTNPARALAFLTQLDFLVKYGAMLDFIGPFVAGLIAFGPNVGGFSTGAVFGAARFLVFYLRMTMLRSDSTAMEELQAAADRAPAPVPMATLTPRGSPRPPPPPATAQQRAIQRYPELKVPSSPLNLEFLRRYKAYRKSNTAYFADPEWPTKLAAESFQAFEEIIGGPP